MDAAELKKVDWTLFSDGEIEDMVDKGLRHRVGVKPQDYLAHWLFLGRQFAFATRDDSWGEFEKLFAIIVKRMIAAEREVKKLVTDRDAWKIIAKHRDDWNKLSDNEKIDTLNKALESEVSDHIKTQDELTALKASLRGRG